MNLKTAKSSIQPKNKRDAHAKRGRSLLGLCVLRGQNQTGSISEHQLLYNQLKQKQKANFEKNVLENKNLNCSNAVFEHIEFNTGISLNLKFTNPNIDFAFDGIEFAGKKNIIPIFITPFEKIT